MSTLFRETDPCGRGGPGPRVSIQARIFVIHDPRVAARMMDRTTDILAAVEAGFEEQISHASLKRVTGAIALLIADRCGLEAVDG